MAQSSTTKSAAPKDRVIVETANFHLEAPLRPVTVRRFVIVKGVVTTPKEAADLWGRDPKDLE